MLIINLIVIQITIFVGNQIRKIERKREQSSLKSKRIKLPLNITKAYMVY